MMIGVDGTSGWLLGARPLGRLILSSVSITCEPAEAMKKRSSTKTTSTIGAI